MMLKRKEPGSCIGEKFPVFCRVVGSDRSVGTIKLWELFLKTVKYPLGGMPLFTW